MEEKKKEMPPIREGKDIKKGEPTVVCGNKKAALPPPVPTED